MSSVDPLRERVVANEGRPEPVPPALLARAFDDAASRPRERPDRQLFVWALLVGVAVLPRFGRTESADRFWSERLLAGSELALLWLEQRLTEIDS